MKKIIAFVTILIFMSMVMTACTGNTVIREDQLNTDSKFSMFVIVEENNWWKIVYDTETRCMYAVSYGGRSYGNFTLLVNPDGTPKLWRN